MKLERNAPCPCGSGRKAKRCCAASSAPAVKDGWQDVLGGLLDTLTLQLTADFPGEVLDDALESYAPFVSEITPDLFQEPADAWLAFAWLPPDDEPLPPGWRAGETAAARFLRRDKTLPPRHRALLEACVREPASWWLIEAHDASDDGVRMTDLFRGESRLVRDAALRVVDGRILFGRFPEHGETVVPLEVLRQDLPASEAERVPQIRAQLQAEEPIAEWLRFVERPLRLAFLSRVLDRSFPTPALELACCDILTDDVEALMGRLTTGLEADPPAALAALDRGGLTWRFMDEATGLPLADGATLRRGPGGVELSAVPELPSFADVRAAVQRQIEGLAASLGTPEAMLARVLDGLFAEPDPPPERALLRRLVACAQASCPVPQLIELVGDFVTPLSRNLVPDEIRELEVLNLLLFRPVHVELGDEASEGWVLGDTVVTRARREGWITGDDGELLAVVADAWSGAWRVLEVLPGGRIRAETITPWDRDTIEARVPHAVSVGDVIGGALVEPAGDVPRFVVVARVDEDGEATLALDGSVSRLVDAAAERAWAGAHRRDHVAEIYRVADAEALARRFEREAHAPLPSCESSFMIDVDVRRATSGELELIEGMIVCGPDGREEEVPFTVERGELRLVSNDAASLSQARVDLPLLMAGITELRWIRQERRASEGEE